MNSSSSGRSATPLERLKAALDDLPAWVRGVDDDGLGPVAIGLREVVDRTEAASAEVLRRFEKSGAYKDDGALSVVAWLRWKCKLSGGAAAERVEIAREVAKLPKTEEAFARGDLGYQQAAIMARSVENVGAAAVRKEEAKLLEAAQTMDAGRFAGVVKNFEHPEARADAGPSRARRPKARAVTRAIEA